MPHAPHAAAAVAGTGARPLMLSHQVVSVSAEQGLSSPERAMSPPRDSDGSGLYLMVSPAMVRSTEALSGNEEVGHVLAGAVVRVLEVAHCSGRIRGRIESPPGWLSIEDRTDGYRWAVRQTTPNVAPCATTMPTVAYVWASAPMGASSCSSTTQTAPWPTHSAVDGLGAEQDAMAFRTVLAERSSSRGRQMAYPPDLHADLVESRRSPSPSPWKPPVLRWASSSFSVSRPSFEEHSLLPPALRRSSPLRNAPAKRDSEH